MEPNPEYLRQLVAHRGMIEWQQQLTDLHISSPDKTHWDAEYFVVAEQLQNVKSRVEKSKQKLLSTPLRIPRTLFTAYQFLEIDHMLDIEMVFKYRLSDLCHHSLWKEESLRYTDRETLKEISNVHPDDDSDVKIREVGEKEINESLSLSKKQMYSKLAETVQKETARVLYYRARDYQARGFPADAWEHAYVFLNTVCSGEDDDAACEEARALVNQDPLAFPLERGSQIPSDRKPSGRPVRRTRGF
jgi:hypothetical protein